MTMAKQMRLMLAAAILSAVSAVCTAQAVEQPGQANSNSAQQQAAPIEHAYPNPHNYPSGQIPQPIEPAEPAPLTLAPGQTIAPKTEASVNPIEGVWLRVGAQSSVKEVARDAGKLELSVEHGLVNVSVLDPDKDMLILVDLPGGQTQVLKNGLYTFNAETNTARVLKGEALAFPATANDKAGDKPGDKPIKVKEYNKVVFSGTDVRPRDFYPEEARADLLRGPRLGPQNNWAPGDVYGYGPYGDGFYGYPPYPYYGYAYPWSWGYPYGYPYYAWGYPWGVSFGFGYYGGWGGWGYRGGYYGRGRW
jgi:hypothetical protein